MDDVGRMSSPTSGVLYRFGLFSLDLSQRLLMRNGVRVRIQEQPLQVLALLLEKHGELTTREEIRQRLWQDNTYVEFDKSLSVAITKVREALADSAANPRFVQTVPRRGYRFIAPLTIDRQPEALASENHSAVVAPHPSLIAPKASLSQLRGSARHRYRWSIALSSLIMLVGLIAFWLHARTQEAAPSPPKATSQAHLRRSVAVLGFRNLSGKHDYDWLSTAFTEMLSTELAASGDLRLMSGEDVANVKRDLSLSRENTLARSTLARLRSNLGADVVILGSYAMLPRAGDNSIRLDLRIQDTALGQTISEQAFTGSENDLFNLASQAGTQLRQSLIPAAALARSPERSRFPGAPNELALQLYSQGRACLIAFDFVGARDFLKRAVIADPHLALAHSALSEAWFHLGYTAEARSEAKRALEQSNDLPPEEALVIRGSYQESMNNWSDAVLTYHSLARRFPDNLTYGLRLVTAQMHVNAADALSTVAALRKLPSPLGDDPRIDLAESSALIGIDIQRARASAERAIDRASGQGATLMVARGFGILCQQNSSVAQPITKSISECELARASYIGAGDFNNAARVLNDLAGIYYQHGKLDQAESLWKTAIEEFRKVGDEQGVAAASNNLGDTLLTRGHLTQARRLLENTVSDYQRIGDLTGVALAMCDLGELALEQADLPTATMRYAQASSIGSQSGDKSSTAYALAGQGDVFLEQANLPDARARYQAALALRKQLGEQQMITETQTVLARLSLEEGHQAAAEAALRQCLAQAHRDQFSDNELTAGLLLVRELLSVSQAAEAVKEIVVLRSLQEHTANRQLQLRFSLQSARTLLATNSLLSSRQGLEAVKKQAEEAGLTNLAWHARLSLAQVKLRLGELAAAREELAFVKDHAAQAGLALLAKEAVSVEREWNSPLRTAAR